jgi:hypothetical protein
MLTRYRIFENQHLLDATEIFRKLNVHKKVSSRAPSHQTYRQLTTVPGILHQARLPPCHVLLLPLQHDRRPHPRRVALNCCHQTTPINFLPTSNALPRRHAPPWSCSRMRARLSFPGWLVQDEDEIFMHKTAHIWVAFPFYI